MVQQKSTKSRTFLRGRKCAEMMIPSPPGPIFSPEFVSRKVPSGHLHDVPFFPPVDADWHYANPASNAADPKMEQAALKSTQSREWRAAMEKELAEMDALGVFEWCFIPLSSNLITC